MKYRLRVLFVVLMGALLLLGGRTVYLRRCAAFHERQARRYVEMIGTYKNITPLEVDLALEAAAENPDDFRLDYKFIAVFHHRSAANVYREAVYHPWTVVHEPPLPERHYED